MQGALIASKRPHNAKLPLFKFLYHLQVTCSRYNDMQLELFPFEPMTFAEKQQILANIKSHYWVIRNTRSWRFGDAPRRKAYRRIEVEKKRLRLAGVSKREILDYLACCRLKCKKGNSCPYCRC